jgi:3-hydroxybutyryl-CoA dehydrogenase
MHPKSETSQMGSQTFVESVTVIGAGTMGRGIAQVCAMAGFRTVLQDIETSVLKSALSQIGRNLDKGRELGKIASEQHALGSRIEITTDFDEAVKECGFLIESVPEELELKLNIFERADERTPPDVVLATNSSSFCVSDIACAVRNPARVVGMHFFNPVHLMRLVEIVKGADTSAQTVETTRAVAQRLQKETVEVMESPGFITTRINALIGNEAFQMLQEGIASARDIDTALKLGLNHPMGPFELIDLVGLDTRLKILQYLHKRLGDKYRPSSLLVEYVRAGRLGRKAGKGVYDYDS